MSTEHHDRCPSDGRRKQLLHHPLIWDEQQFCKLLVDYLEHRNSRRPHPGISQCSPDSIDQDRQRTKTSRRLVRAASSRATRARPPTSAHSKAPMAFPRPTDLGSQR